MHRSIPSLGPTVFFLGLVAASAVACSSSTTREGAGAEQADAGGGAPAFVDDANPEEKTYSPEEIWATDPPPKWCGPANGEPAPPPPGGTPECPDDKNREGCPCKKVGDTAKCWPGKRQNRNLGVCQDGTTRCEANGELGKAWGKCEGFVLPDKEATKGKDACKCFSQGQWKLDNVVPCFITSSNGDYASSAECDPNNIPPNTKPSTPWSANSLTVDCAGHFKLCYSLKAGDAKNPSPSDCTLMTVCTEDDYVEANKLQAFPKLPGWVSNDAACVAKIKNGGAVYGEMTVTGKSVLCDEINDNGKPLVFNRVQYCPMDCGSRPTDPDCAQCGSGGSGSF